MIHGRPSALAALAACAAPSAALGPIYNINIIVIIVELPSTSLFGMDLAMGADAFVCTIRSNFWHNICNTAVAPRALVTDSRMLCVWF